MIKFIFTRLIKSIILIATFFACILCVHLLTTAFASIIVGEGFCQIFHSGFFILSFVAGTAVFVFAIAAYETRMSDDPGSIL